MSYPETTPNLAGLSDEVRAYIDALHAELARVLADNARLRAELQEPSAGPRGSTARAPRNDFAEQGDLVTAQYAASTMLITLSAQGVIKRTPLNAYSKQRRGGMGVYDIKLRENDTPAFLCVADEADALLVVTTRCRGFRVPVRSLRLAEVRDRGDELAERLRLTENEQISAMVALTDATETTQPWVLMTSASGVVRRIRRNVVGSTFADGTLLYDPKEGGAPVAVCLSKGDGDLFLATNSGMGIRFEEKLTSHRPTRGIKLGVDERVVGLTPVNSTSAVLLISADGQGVRRPMDNFAASKSPGGQGKIAIKTDHLVGVFAVQERDEVLCISNFAKLIRFDGADVPPRTGVAQGVNVMELRGDHVAAVTVVTPPA